VNSAQTKNPGHQQAVVALHTGSETFVRPSVGAWVTYGLGTEADDLPGFITIDPMSDLGGAGNYGSAFLPATFQGTRLSSGGGGVPNLYSDHLSSSDQRKQVDFIQRLNRRAMDRLDPGNPEMEGIIQSYELAYKMQTSVPKVFDIDGEPPHVLDLYGIGQGETDRLWHGLPDGSATGGEGCAFHPAHEQRMGPPQQHPRGLCRARGEHRQAHRRPDRRPEAARHAEGHTDRVER